MIREQAAVLFERGLVGEGLVHGQRADDPAFEADRDADERDDPRGGRGVRAGAVEKARVLADVGHDDGRALLDGLSRDALADLIGAAALLLLGEAVGRLDVEPPGGLVHEHERAAAHLQPARRGCR